MNSNRNYIIPFVGLKLGVHEFEFEITDTFFESFEYSIIQKGKVHVNLSLEKKETMMVGDFVLTGTVETECARCNDLMDVPINGTYRLIYQFGEEPSDDETLVTVYPEQFEIDVKENILELITVSLPVRPVHEEGECNEEMISIMSEYVLVSNDELEESEDAEDEEEVDPRWAELNKLKQDKKS